MFTKLIVGSLATVAVTLAGLTTYNTVSAKTNKGCCARRGVLFRGLAVL